jgi:asparagine synthase (glutamine-hydrolysing)
LTAPPIDADPVETLSGVFEEMAPLIVQADVPVGIALSGGLDSSLVAALAAQSKRSDLHAFSVGYPGRPSNDERQDARMLADHLKIDFHEVELDTASLVADFPALVRATDDPIADIAGYGYRAVSRLARDHGVPVLLQGQGGDELFWGYSWVRQGLAESLLKAGGSGHLARYLSALLPSPFNRRGLRNWRRAGCGLGTAAALYRRLHAMPRERLVFFDLVPDFAYAEQTASQYFAKSMGDGLNAARWFTQDEASDRLDLILTKLISSIYLRENGIAQGDRLAMAASVEMRLPLVDHVLVETVIGLRKARPDSHLPPKAWLRTVARRFLPDFALNRPKRGFAPPTRQWQEGLLQCYAKGMSDGYLAQTGLFDNSMLTELTIAERWQDDRERWQAFKFLLLEIWCRDMAAVAESAKAP